MKATRERSRVRPVRAWAVACALGLGACETDAPPAPTEDSATEPKAPTTEVQAKAQREALTRLAPLSARVAALEDPLTSALRDGTAPGLPPIGAAGREALRAAVVEAARESEGLQARLLESRDRVVALTARFVLDRARDALDRRRPYRTDPGWVLMHAEGVVDALETDARRTGTCTHCEASLRALAAALPLAQRELGAASIATTRAARDDARALATRVEALRHDLSDAPTALRSYATHLDAVAAALPAADEVAYDAVVPPAASPALVRRLPNRVPAKELQRRLEVEENVGADATASFTKLGSTVAQLGALTKKRPAPAKAPPAAVDLARCESAWTPLAALAASQPSLAPGDFGCASFVAGLGATPLTDAELSMALVDTALVSTTRATNHAALPPVLSSVGGRLTRAAQAYTLRTALLLGTPEATDAAATALEAELDAACLAAAALWIHGELGTDEDLETRLTGPCPRETSAYLADAQARPRRALAGMALARVAEGPAGVVPLDKYWWLPLGLVTLVADPSRTEAPQSAGVEMKVEPVQPSGQEPAAP